MQRSNLLWVSLSTPRHSCRKCVSLEAFQHLQALSDSPVWISPCDSQLLEFIRGMTDGTPGLVIV